VRPYVWIVRVCFLLVAGALGVGAVQARQGADEELRSESGVTGQRQALEMELDGDGKPQRFATVLYLQCSGGTEWRMTWTAGDGESGDFDWDGDRLEVVERREEDYGSKGGSSAGPARMVARTTTRGLEGHVRMVWRLQRPDRREVCDTGYVPFAVGAEADGRVTAMRPAARPWVAYPEDLEPAVPASRAQQRFLMRLDATCLRWSEQRPRDSSFEDYADWHQLELDALQSLGRSPRQNPAYAAWIQNFERRLELERAQVKALERSDLGTAARLRAANSALKAQGNARALRIGLRACASNGPAGAPTS